jgi:DNA-binding GntR family transcriptional regulator
MKVAGQSGLDARSLDWRAADMLRQQILSGGFPPGHRLTETVLAHELDVSRGTVRAALRSLTYEGLVAQVAYSKWLVPELTPEDANEITTLHAALTGLAARLAAETGIVGPGEDRDMPIRLADAARMPRLAEQLQVIGRQIQRYQAALALTAVASEDWSPCLAAIGARDAAEAESLARTLIVARHRPLLERLKSGTTALNNKTGGNHHD